MKTFTTPKGFVMEQSDIDDMVSSCFEGACNYWMNRIKPSHYPEGATYGSEVLTRGAIIDIWYDDEEEQTKTLTLDMFLNGIDMYLEWRKNQGYKNVFETSEDLACDGDADFPMQYALFGEVIYG